MSPVLRSSETHHRQQQRYILIAIAAARRAWRLGLPTGMLPALAVLQGLAAEGGAASVPAALAEQNIDVDPVAEIATGALIGVASDGRPLGSLLEQATTGQHLVRIAVTQVADASRVAAGLEITVRPEVGWTRMVNPPCCARCAILAGKFYRWNVGFDRHPGCDCSHIPTREDVSDAVSTNPQALFEQGHVNGVTQAERKAIAAGADLNQVVNARRSIYMDPAGRRLTHESTTARGGRGIDGIRPTPEQIYREAGDNQAEALRLLKRFGFIN